MQAVVLSIGDELVLGQTVDTNTAWLSAKLAELGITTLYHQTVADDRAAITLMIKCACEVAGLVIISGGIGPTEDDLTRQALADAMGVDLVLDENSLTEIQTFFACRNRAMSENNRIQAMHPAGSVMLANRCGTAPGIMAEVGGAKVFVTPGVPREMKAMYEESILPVLTGDGTKRKTIVTTKVNSFGIGESTIGLMLGDMMDRGRNPKIGTTAQEGMVGVRIRAEFDDAAEAKRQLEMAVDEVKGILGPAAFGRDDEQISDSLIALLKETGQSAATAESCTGGLVSKMLTDVPGSSEVYRGGWVTYSNEMKVEQLGVDGGLIEAKGAVSGEVARAMACGAVLKSGADVAVGITGIAGPDGGTAEKPVGTVWVGIAWRGGHGGGDIESQAYRFLLPGHRQAVRERAAGCAIQMMRMHLMGVDIGTMQWANREDD